MSDEVTMDVREDGVAVLTIRRPEKRNALRFEDLAALEHHLGVAARSAEVRALVITGSGGSFCAGIDLADLAGRGTGDRGGAAREESIARWRLVDLPKPVVAAVDGPAVGMGVELTCQADVRVASPEAWFSWNFGQRGLVPDMGVSSLVLPSIVGLPTALELMYSGRRLGAEEAKTHGYVAEVTADPVGRAAELAVAMSRFSPFALQQTKRLVYRGLVDPEDHLQRHDEALRACFASADHHEGVTAFLERREPRFAGLGSATPEAQASTPG